jgi:antitoxin FitA
MARVLAVAPGPVEPGQLEIMVTDTAHDRIIHRYTSTTSGEAVSAFDMLPTCSYLFDMSRMIQLRHVPDDLHRKLKVRAAMEGLSLSDYLLQEVRRVAERPTLTELRQRLNHRTPVVSRVPPARAVRAERERK